MHMTKKDILRRMRQLQIEFPDEHMRKYWIDNNIEMTQAEIKYSSSYKAIIYSLADVKEYRDLTISQVDQLITFLPTELHPDGRIDFYYGDYLLKKEHQI